MLRAVFLRVGLLLSLAGCWACTGATWKGDGRGDSEEARVAELASALRALGPGVDREEAGRAARAAIAASRRLAAAYRVSPPARWHNLLVQLGARERGLCYHWTEDLMQEMQALGLRTLEMHWGVAHRGSDLREHNSVVVTAAGRPFAEGLVLDPWRESGRLVWVRVREDRYPWEPLPREQW
ncbi:MAG: hypothetical protein WHT06_02975 [Desulfobacterales bacterium]